AAKQAAAAMRGGKGGDASAQTPNSASTPAFSGVNFAGAAQGRNGINAFPSDAHGAASPKYFVETTNSSFDIFKKANPGSSGNLVESRSLAAFFGTTEVLVQARVLYDSTWGRFLVLANDLTVNHVRVGIS